MCSRSIALQCKCNAPFIDYVRQWFVLCSVRTSEYSARFLVIVSHSGLEVKCPVLTRERRCSDLHSYSAILRSWLLISAGISTPPQIIQLSNFVSGYSHFREQNSLFSQKQSHNFISLQILMYFISL